ncbi:MAG TPA: hypothetical protein VG387_05255 [Rhizomicrobium sp.]|jgi:hypothetical protein|nr:hypothetical protein [Rhizomicrobium sp.]
MTDNGNRYALSALTRQRATFAGEVAALKKRLAWAEQQLVHVDATLRLLDPKRDPDTIPAKRPQKRIKLFRQGELSRMIIDALRRAAKPVDAAAIVGALLAAGGHKDGARAALAPRVRSNLAYLQRRSKVIKLGAGRAARWSLSQ